MDFSFNESCLSDSASRALGAIIGKFKSLKNVGFKTFTKLYDQLVTPTVDYASDVLGFGSFNSIDNLQNRTLRYFLGVHRYAPILGLQGDSEWVPPRVRRTLCMIRLWNKLVKINDNSLTKFVFLWDLDQSVSFRNWSYEVKQILEVINMTNFNTKTTVDIDVAKKPII